MTAWMIVWTACVVMATEAVPCHNTQQCSDCDRDTGDCLTECDTGYYGRRCKSTCSRNCRNNTCGLSEYGSSNCTEGCVPGYYGFGCGLPCDSPGGSCAACPGGCDGGYCQLGSSCVSGCVDSYYGTGCDTGAQVGLSVGLSVAAVIVILLLVLYCKYGQGFRKKTAAERKDVLNNVAKRDDVTVDELEWYTDIPTVNTVKAYESSGRKCRGGSGDAGFTGDVYDVADEGKRGFLPVIDNIYSKLSHA